MVKASRLHQVGNVCVCVCVCGGGGGGGLLANSPNSHMESFNNNK